MNSAQDLEFATEAAAPEGRAELIKKFESRRTQAKYASWLMFAVLCLNGAVAVFSDSHGRWIDFSVVLNTLLCSLFAAQSLWCDALIKSLRLASAR